jgi:cell division protein FtsI/penicillin-binding protein 2
MEAGVIRRFKVVVVVVALIFSLLVVRIVKLMFFQKDLILSSPDTSAYRERGLIVDRHGEKLALSLETYSVYARPREIDGKGDAARILAAALGADQGKLYELLNRRRPFVWLQRQVDVRRVKALESLDVKGVYLEKEYRRFYPYDSLLCHVVGFAGIDNRGLEGIEYQFNDLLMPRNPGKGNSPEERGSTVVLTVDRYVQEVVEEELARAWVQTGARHLSAVVMDPSTGEILALANKPDYNLNDFTKYPEDTLRNRVITDTFEPGSTFKIFIAASLLDKGLVRPGDIFTCNGSVQVEGITIRDTSAHGRLDFRQVLEKSCNVGMVESVRRTDKASLFESLRSFGFGSPTGIELPGEARGILRNPSEWSGISKYAMAIGQEMSVTSLQLVTAASVLANGGVLMQPRIIRRIERPDGTRVKDYPPLKVRTVMSEGAASRLLDILTGVLGEKGTGYRAHIEGYRIAGKTGTAQIADTRKGGYLENQFYASFVGFVPVPKPKIVVLVALDRPVGEVYGGSTAAPIFKNIVEQVAPHLNILSSFSKIYILKNDRE